MKKTALNIHDKSSIFRLTPGKYDVLILGGWKIEEHRFKVHITDVQNKESITVKRTKWPVQSIEFGRRAKRYYEFEILNEGEFNVYCENPESLKVKRSNLMMFDILFKYVDNHSLEILITQK